jgi:two-component system phosphate regulon sensor histidine kinase PhoR
MFRIQVRDAEDHLVHQFPLTDNPIVFGRDSDSTVPLAAANVSRSHAVIEPYGNFYVVKDLGSTNGTWVNKKPITSHILKAGDIVYVGNFRILVDETNQGARQKASGKPFRETSQAKIFDSEFDVDGALESGRTFQIKVGKEITSLSGENVIWDRLMRLHDVSREIGLIETPEILYQKVVETVMLELEADRVALLVTDETGELEAASAISALDDDSDEAFHIHKGILTAVTREMTAILTEDAGLDNRFERDVTGKVGRVYSVMCVPLVAEQRLLGVVYLDRVHNVAPFSEDDLRLLTIISSQVSTSIINAELFQDVLTEKVKIRMVIDNLRDGLVLTNSDFIVEKYNEAAAKVLGGVGKYLLGNNLLEALQTADGSFDAESFDSAVEKNTNFQFQPDSDAAQRSYNIAVGSYARQESKDRGVLFSFRDTTGLVKLEMMKSEFIRTASHKMRTPLTVLVGNLELLKEEIAEHLDPTGVALVAGLEKNLEQILRLVDRFVEFVELDGTSDEFLQVDIDEVLTTSWAGLKMRADDKQIRLVKAYDSGEEFLVSGVHQRLIQCFTNILDNAIKFSPERSVVTTDILPDEDSFNVHIRDEGPGVPAEKLPLIFSSFQQVEKKPTGEVQGVGLGLTIAKRILHNHKASIRVESPSRSGKGTEFILSFSKNPLQPERMEYVETDMIPFLA